MLLSYDELIKLIDDNVITNIPYSAVNSSSIDITLGDIFWKETSTSTIIDLAAKEAPTLERLWIDEFINLHPQEFILAQSKQIFNLPNNISAEYKLNSSLARAGLDHLNAGWCDAGWNGSALTLEFKNCLRYQTLLLKPGMKCGQMLFFKHELVPNDASYSIRGQYNGDMETSPTKGLQPVVPQPQSERRTGGA